MPVAQITVPAGIRSAWLVFLWTMFTPVASTPCTLAFKIRLIPSFANFLVAYSAIVLSNIDNTWLLLSITVTLPMPFNEGNCLSRSTLIASTNSAATSLPPPPQQINDKSLFFSSRDVMGSAAFSYASCRLVRILDASSADFKNRQFC